MMLTGRRRGRVDLVELGSGRPDDVEKRVEGFPQGLQISSLHTDRSRQDDESRSCFPPTKRHTDAKHTASLPHSTKVQMRAWRKEVSDVPAVSVTHLLQLFLLAKRGNDRREGIVERLGTV